MRIDRELPSGEGEGVGFHQKPNQNLPASTALTMTMTKDHTLGPECMGLGLGQFPVRRTARIMQKECVYVFLCKPRATQNEVSIFVLLELR